MRVFPLSNWTELDVWQYIRVEEIPLPSIYFAHQRDVFERDGMLYAANPYVKLLQGEQIRNEQVRFRTIGDMTCFSFYATKPLAAGEGGMVTTANEEWAERIRILRLHGISRDAWKRYSTGGSWYYEVHDAGYKYNMTDIQAALGISQLRKLDAMREMRKRIADRYTEAFSRTDALTPLDTRADRSSSCHLYVLCIDPDAHDIDRAGFIEELGRRGIGTSVHFIPLHRHPFYRNSFGYEANDFPCAERFYERVISLPIYPGMTGEETDYVIESIKDVSSKHRK